mgnify:CR=1 FL=1
MKVRLLKDNWTLTVLGDNVYHIPETPIETTVPSTVYETLLKKKLMPDPFYRDNELDATKLMENEFLYETAFTIDEEERSADRIFLHFDGIDTIADLYLNDKKIRLGREYESRLGIRYYIACKGRCGGYGLSAEKCFFILRSGMQRWKIKNAQSEQLLMRCLAFRIFERLPACMDGIGVQDSQMPDCFDVFLSCR